MSFRHFAFAAALATSALVAAPLAGPAAAQDIAGPYLAATQAAFRNDYAAAARYYVEAANEDPGNPFLIQNSILNTVIIGDFDAAVPLAEALRDLDADMQLGGLVLVADALRREDYAAAMAHLNTEKFMLNPLLSGLLKGWVAAGMGETTEAGDHFDRLAKDTNFGQLGQYHKALVFALAGNFDGTSAIFAGDGNGPLRVNRASIIAHVQALMQLDHREEALDVIDDALALGPSNELMALRRDIEAGNEVPFTYVTSPRDGAGEVFLTLATALSQEEAGRFALLYARLAQEVRPGYVDALILTADIFEEQGQYALSTADYAAVPKSSPIFRSAEIGRANALASGGHAEEAVVALRELAALFPEDRFVHVALGDMLRHEEEYTQSAESYSEAIKLIDTATTSDWRTFYVRGIAYERMDEWDKAEADFRRSLELSPDQPLVLNYLGYSLVEKQIKIDEARDMIERAVAARPNDGYITDSLGWVLYRLGKFEEAVPHMERAAELLPTDPIINDHLGDVFWKVGREREAVFQWRRALSFDPEPEEAEKIRLKLDIGLDAALDQWGEPGE